MYIYHQAAFFFAISFSPMKISETIAEYIDANLLINIIPSIGNIKAKEFLLLTCYDLI
jgi:hypothetical protein